MKKQALKTGIGRRACALIAAGALAASTVASPLMAFAVDPSAGDQTGSGSTSITVYVPSASGEYCGTDDALNPDADGDGFGDNIAFSVPASINFVATANGKLIGPSASETYIQNRSTFAIHASSMKVDRYGTWNIVADASVGSDRNQASYTFGPEGDILNASSYLTKKAVGDPSQWNMAANGGKVELHTAGKVANVESIFSGDTPRIGTIHTFVTAGEGTAPAQP